MIRRVVPLVIVAALVGACAPVAKQDAVRRISRAVDTVGVRAGAITVTTRAIDAPQLPSGATNIGAPTEVVPPAALSFVVDRAARRAALLAPPAAAARIGISEGNSFPALVIFDRERVYVRSPDANLIGARPWLGMDLSELGAVTPAVTDELSQPRTFGDLAVVSPIQLLDLALGVLTGSVKRSGSLYKANTSIEKEYRQRRLEPSDADDFVQALRSFASKDDINPIEVDLDTTGLRGVSVDFIGRPEYGIKFATRFALAFDPAAPVDKTVLRVPPRDDVVEVTSLGDIRSAIDEWTLTEVGA